MASKSPRKKRGGPPPLTQSCDLSDQARAASLPPEVLHIILKHLKPIDVVSAGQVCHGWRVAAKDELLWRDVALDYLPPGSEKRNAYGKVDFHSYSKEFTRIVQFATALRNLKVVGPVKTGTRPAMANSHLKLREVCFDGSKEYLVKYACKHTEELEAAAFWNANNAAAKAAAGLGGVERLSLCYPKVHEDPDDLTSFYRSFWPSKSKSQAAGTSKEPKAPPGPYTFLPADLPALRQLQLLRVPDVSARSLLELRGPSLDSLDTDSLAVTLPLLHTLVRLERLVLRCNQHGIARGQSLRQRLQEALPVLKRLSKVSLLIDTKPKPDDWYDDYGYMNEWDEDEECECVQLRAMVNPMRHPLLSVVCMICDKHSPSTAALAEEDMQRFVYTGPRKPFKKQAL